MGCGAVDKGAIHPGCAVPRIAPSLQPPRLHSNIRDCAPTSATALCSAAKSVLLARLPSDPFGVEVVSSHQTLMVAFIDDASLVHHQNLGRVPNGA
jgi:hypothetical protein